MRGYRYVKGRIRNGVAVAAMVLGCHQVHAATSTWSNTDTGNWDVAGNWTGGVPASGVSTYLNNAGTATIQSGVTATTGFLAVGSSSGASGTIQIDGGSLKSSLFSLGNAAGSTGTLNLTSGYMGNPSTVPTGSANAVGEYGTGYLTISGGTMNPKPSPQSSLGSLAIGVYAGSSGTVTLSGGTLDLATTPGRLTIGAGGTGSLLINGGTITLGTDTNIAVNTGSNGSARITSGSWSTHNINVGSRGTGSLTVEGGTLSATSIAAGATATGSGSVIASGGTMSGTGDFVIGKTGTATALINGGSVSYRNASFGQASGSSGTTTISSGSLTFSGALTVADSGTGGLTVSGGTLQSDSAIIGNTETSLGTVLITGGSWTNTGTLTLGALGSHATLTVQTGGRLSTGDTTIGSGSGTDATAGLTNSLIVTGANARFVDSGSLLIGGDGSGNTVAVSDGALVMVGDANGETIGFSTGTGTDNYLRIDGGYVALFGDQVANITSFITGSRLQVWNGTDWMTSTDTAHFSYAYYATESAAQTFSGYSGLAGYTILTAVPEPGTAALALLGAATALLARRHRQYNAAR